MKKIVAALIVASTIFLGTAFADEAEDRAAVVDMVQTFFDAMTARDAGALKSLLTHDGIFYGYREEPDGLIVVRPTHESYANGFAEPGPKMIERFWDPTVLLHGRMAAVWTPYDLFVDGEFSHCGIDNFNFLKTNDGWKITGIVFSMERENCPESPLGPLQQ